MVMRHLKMSLNDSPKDSASLMVLAELRDVLTQKLASPDCPAFALNQAFQNLLVAAFKAVVEMTYPASSIYPSTFDHVDTFKFEVATLAGFFTNCIKASTEYNQPR